MRKRPSNDIVFPQAIEQEESLIASLLLIPEDVVPEIADNLLPGDFYRKSHQLIFAAALYLHRKSEPVSLVTITDQLRDEGKLDECGGAAHLSALLENPLSTSLSHTVKKIKQKAVNRQVIKEANEIIKMAMNDPDDVLDEAQRRIMAIKYDEAIDAKTLQEIVMESMERYDLRSQSAGLTGEPYGFVDLDGMTSGMQSGDLIIIAGRPAMGKSALAHNIAMQTTGPAALFSLEMSQEQLGDRFLSSESGLNGMKLRTGNIVGDDWTRLNKAAARLHGKKMFINDDPMLTITGVSRKMRGLVRKHEVKVCIVDYLQLMESEERRKRHLELGEISRRLKLMARDLKIPVVALSQLNRDLEKREDKRPRLADLRESGCLRGNTNIFNHNLNKFVKMESLDNDIINMIDSYSKTKGESIMAKGKKCFPTGKKQFYKITLSTGHEIEATKNHKFLSPGEEWTRLDRLSKESLLGIPLNFTYSKKNILSNNAIKIIAMFLGNGCCLPSRSLQYTSHVDDIDLCNEIMDISNAEFNDELRPYIKHQIYRKNTKKESESFQIFFPAIRKVSRRYRNPMVLFFEKYGMYNKRHKQKEIPGEIFTQSLNKKRLFIKYLWATDGSVPVSPMRSKGKVGLSYSSTSLNLIKQLQVLLQSVGILSNFYKIRQSKYSWYSLGIYSRYFIEKFLNEIGVAGNRKGYKVKEAKKIIKTISPGWTKYELSDCKNIAYVPIKEIKKTDIDNAYDIEVPVTHNFFANGIIVHNSLEQDSDVVLMVYRDVMYHPDDESNEMEIIIRKQRMGPTGVVYLTWDDTTTTIRDRAH